MTGNGTKGHSIQLAQGLGWFSLGLGLAELLAPAGVARLAGIPQKKGMIRLMGLREIASGLAIFIQRKPKAALWARVTGDLVDLGLLGSALKSRKADPARIAAAATAVAGITALDIYCCEKLTLGNGSGRTGIKVEKSVTINRSPDDLYAFWRPLQHLPRFMAHLKSVERVGDNKWHWVAKGPAGKDVEWDAEIITDHPNELIGWRSLEGADVDNAGSVRFERAPGGRGTVVSVKLQYYPPAGHLGAIVAKLFGEDPEKQIAVDLRQFKQLMETGEILETEGQSAGRATSTSRRFDEMVRS